MRGKKNAVDDETRDEDEDEDVEVEEDDDELDENDPTIMFKATICKISFFIQIFDCVKDMIKNCIIHATAPVEGKPASGGLTITVFNKKAMMLLKTRIPAAAFEKFYVAPEFASSGVSIGVKYKSFLTLLKMAKKEDSITLMKTKEDVNVLTFIYENSATGIRPIFNLNLSTLKDKDISIPETEFIVQITMDTRVFHKLMKDAASLSEDLILRFIHTEEVPCTLYFETQSDMGSGGTPITLDSRGVEMKIRYQGKDIHIKNKYELKKLLLFGKCHELCECVVCHIKYDFPLVIRYKLAYDAYVLIMISASNEEVDDDDEEEDDGNDFTEGGSLPKKTKAKPKAMVSKKEREDRQLEKEEEFSKKIQKKKKASKVESSDDEDDEDDNEEEEDDEEDSDSDSDSDSPPPKRKTATSKKTSKK
jgi:proliferating cell nuclear antigen PCNA